MYDLARAVAWEWYDLHHYLARITWIGSNTMYAGPAQPFTTEGEELDNLSAVDR